MSKSREVVLHRERGRSIREEADHHNRRRLKYFFLWACNSGPVMVATAMLLLTVLVVMTSHLMGAHGPYFVLWMLVLMGFMASLWQLFAREVGYTTDDWLK